MVKSGGITILPKYMEDIRVSYKILELNLKFNFHTLNQGIINQSLYKKMLSKMIKTIAG